MIRQGGMYAVHKLVKYTMDRFQSQILELSFAGLGVRGWGDRWIKDHDPKTPIHNNFGRVSCSRYMDSMMS